jgi:hypothetical protein
MIIYGVYWINAFGEDELQNLYAKGEDAEAFVESKKYPLHYYVQELQVY